MPREKSRYRDRRSSSSNSSESSYERKKKSKHKRRSRSRDRSESSSRRRKRSISRSKRKRRSYSRSVSRDRYEKSRRTSRSRRERSHSRSSSRGKSKYKSSKKSRRRSRSSSRSSLYEGNEDLDSEDLSRVIDSLLKLNLRNKRAPLLSAYLAKRPTSSKLNLDDTEIKLEKAIKAAAAAGLSMTKIPTYEYKEVDVKEDMPTIHDRNLLEELNSDSFIQKSFTSSAKKKDSKNIVIDFNSETITMPEIDVVKQEDESIINLDAIPDEAELIEMWIKKLYQFRKRMLKGEI